MEESFDRKVGACDLPFPNLFLFSACLDTS
jgi:hypothetical protein